MRLRYAIGCFAIVCASVAQTQVPSVKSGVEAWQRGDHAAAVAIWRNLAEKGNADAAFNLGQAYRLGRGVPADSAQAKRWFELAASKGHVDAQVSLGLLLFDSGDRATSMIWLKRAAEKGEPRALLVVGTALFNGEGLPQDPILGYAYVSRAAAQGLAPAKSTLAEMDKILTVDERRKGVAIALAAAKGQPQQISARKTEPSQQNADKISAAAKPTTKIAAAEVTPAKAPLKSQAAATGVWRVQLGAFSTKGAAEALFKKLSGSAALAGRQPYYVAVGKITRLQAGPFDSKASASSACSRLAPKACFPVQAR